MLSTWEFWAGVVLGIMGLFLFVMGAWVKRDFRGRALNRFRRQFALTQGIFTLTLAMELLLQHFYRKGPEGPHLSSGG